MIRTKRTRLTGLFLAGWVAPIVGATVALAAPSASASACSSWKYASWGSAATCVSDSRLSIDGYDRDDKTDGYCVEVAVGVRNSAGVIWGNYGYPGSTNCKDGVIKNFSGYASSSLASRGYKYFCRTQLVRGDYDAPAQHAYLTLWSERGCTNN